MAWANGRTIRDLAGQVVTRWGWRCWICKEPISPAVSRRRSRGLSVDHVVPRSRGGGDDLVNLRPAHLGCNSARGNKRHRPATTRRAAVVHPLLAGLTAGFSGQIPADDPGRPFLPQTARKNLEDDPR